MTPIKPRARDDLALVQIDGEAVIYDDINEGLHHLNPTATIVFSLLDGSASMGELATEIADAYDAPKAEVERHVRTLVREFRKAGLLEDARAARAPRQTLP